MDEVKRSKTKLGKTGLSPSPSKTQNKFMELDTLSIKMSRINEIMLKSNISQNDLNGTFDFQSTFREDGKV